MGRKYEYCARGIAFGSFAILLEITFFILYCVLVQYGSNYVPPWIYEYYNQTSFLRTNCCSVLCLLEHNSSMVLLGLGLLFCVLKCSSISAIGFTLFLLSIIMQWAALIIPWLFQAALKLNKPQDIYMNVPIMCDITFAAISLIIAYGAWVGRMSRIQSTILSIIGVVIYGVNRMVVLHYLGVNDVNGSMTVYMFGALYGLAALYATIIGDRNWCCKFKDTLQDGYHVYVLGFIGTLILWLNWPKLNAYALPAGSDLVNRSILNTYFALISSATIAYAMSSFVTSCCKLTITHVQYGTIAGAVIVSTVAPLITQIWGAILIGSFAGFSVILFVRYLGRMKYLLPDSLGILWTFGFSGFVGGIASAIMAAIIYKVDGLYTTNELILLYPAVVLDIDVVGAPRSAAVQGGYQMAGVCVSLGMAIVGGAIAGALVRWIGPFDDDEYFDDSAEWKICCNHPISSAKCERQLSACERVSMPPI